MDQDNTLLFMERLGRALDRMQSELQEIRALLKHSQALSEQRFAALEESQHDHEQRLREVQTGVTQFKTWGSVLGGSSGLMALASLLRSFFGG